MPVYEYQGLDSRGKKTAGLVDADSPRTARQRLRKQGVFTTNITEGKVGSKVSSKPANTSAGSSSGGGLLSREIDVARYFERIGVQDIAIATRQLGSLLGAGVPLVEAIGVLSEQVEKERFRLILREVKERVNEGSGLADALGKYPKVFSNLYVNMVRAGEHAGALDQVLDRLSDYTEAQVELRAKVTSALVYPVLMLVVAIAVIAFLLAAVIPKITKIFKSRDQELPAITQLVIWVSEVLQAYWWAIGLFGIAAGFLFVKWYRTDEGREKVDRVLLKVPIFGAMARMVAISRFASTLSTLMVSGVPLLSGMKIVHGLMGNIILQDAIGSAQDAVREGEPMNRPLQRSGEFPPMFVHMVAVGERTGELPQMLERVASTYERQVNRRVETMTSLLEPLMILVMGGVVFTIALAVLLPMLDMNTLGR